MIEEAESNSGSRAEIEVGISCLCIPDGIERSTKCKDGKTSADGTQDKALLSLVLTPDLDFSRGPSGIDFHRWTESFRWDQEKPVGFAVYVIKETEMGLEGTLIDSGTKSRLFTDHDGMTRQRQRFDAARKLWDEIFFESTRHLAPASVDEGIRAALKYDAAEVLVVPPDKSFEEADSFSIREGRRTYEMMETLTYDYQQLASVAFERATEEVTHGLGLRLAGAVGGSEQVGSLLQAQGDEARETMQRVLARASRPMDPRVALSYATDGWKDIVPPRAEGDAFGLLNDLIAVKRDAASAATDNHRDDENGSRQIFDWMKASVASGATTSGKPAPAVPAPQVLRNIVAELNDSQTETLWERIAQGRSIFSPPRVKEATSEATPTPTPTPSMAERRKTALAALQTAVRQLEAVQADSHCASRWAKADAPENIIRRKLGAIKSFPTLAKFLCLIVDLRIDLGKLEEIAIDEKSGTYHGSIVAVPHRVGDLIPPKIDDKTLAKLARTAFEMSTAGNSSSFKTMTRTRAEHLENRSKSRIAAAWSSVHPLDEGVINLRAKIGDDPRFTLQTVDMLAAMKSGQVQTEANKGQKRTGSWPDGVVAKSPELRTRGIALLDSGMQTQTMAEMTLPHVAGDDARLFTEDLIVGYRLDAKRTRMLVSGETIHFPWQSLMAREVIVKQIHAALGVSVPTSRFQCFCHPFGERFRERDDGIIRVATKVVEQDTVVAGEIARGVKLRPSQVLATWGGGSLGLPALSDAALGNPAPEATPSADVEYLPWKDLGIDVEYRCPADPSRFPHVLRIGDGYEFGMRYVLPNGASVSLAQATRLYGSNSLPDCGAFTFRQNEEVPAPDVCLPIDDPTTTPGTGPLAGDQDELILLSADTSKGKGRATVKRFLVPPRTTFDHLEQFGVFDELSDQVPAGGLNKYVIDKAPLTKKADKTQPTINKAFLDVVRRDAPRQSPDHHAPGLVLSYSSKSTWKPPFYPNPLARNVGLAFIRDNFLPEGFEELAPPIVFWPVNKPLTATPIELLFKRWSESSSGGRFNPPRLLGAVSGGPKITQVMIDVAPAEEIDLLIWSYADEEATLRSQALPYNALWTLAKTAQKAPARAAIGDAMEGTLKVLRRRLSDLSKRCDLCPPETFDAADMQEEEDGVVAADQIWQVMFGKVPVPGVTMWRRLRIVHAVEKPLLAPAFRRDSTKEHPTRLRFNIIRTTDKWTKVVGDTEDLLERESDKKGTVGYIVGDLVVDRPSTGSLRCEAAWSNAGERGSVFRETPRDPWQLRLNDRHVRTLFEIPQVIRDHGQNPGRQVIDLVKDEFGALRGLNYTFDGTRAHKLRLRLVAKSRYASSFEEEKEEEKPVNTGALTRFEAESCPRLDSDPREREVACEEFWLKATDRPGVPQIDKVIWIHPEEVIRRDSKRIIVTKRATVRVYLDRYWFDSGEGELLGVICWPPTLVDNHPEQGDPNDLPPARHHLDPGEAKRADDLRRLRMCDLDDCADFAVKYVTRWGTDPTTVSSDLPPLIGPEHFAGYVRKASGVRLPAPGAPSESPTSTPTPTPTATTTPAPSNPENTIPIAVLGYEPRFDENEGLWYCDIDFDPGPAHAPFVRFGVVRYQPHAIEGKELSQPIALDPLQVPPRRTVDIYLDRPDRVVIDVSGVGYQRRLLDYCDYPEAEKTEEALRNITDVPLQKFWIKRAAGPLLDSAQRGPGLVQVFDRTGRALESQFVQPIESETGLRWITAFELPEPVDAGQYSLVVEETELFTSDPDTRPSTAHPVIGQLVDVPGKFACTIPLSNLCEPCKAD